MTRVLNLIDNDVFMLSSLINANTDYRETPFVYVYVSVSS